MKIEKMVRICWNNHVFVTVEFPDVVFLLRLGPQGAASHPKRLLPGHVHSRHEGAGPGQDPHERADSRWVWPHPSIHVLRLAGAQHAHSPRDPAGNIIHIQ